MSTLSAVKYNRLVKLSRWSKYPRTFRVIIEQLDEFLVVLTAKQGAKLIDAWQDNFSHGKAVGFREKGDLT